MDAEGSGSGDSGLGGWAGGCGEGVIGGVGAVGGGVSAEGRLALRDVTLLGSRASTTGAAAFAWSNQETRLSAALLRVHSTPCEDYGGSNQTRALIDADAPTAVQVSGLELDAGAAAAGGCVAFGSNVRLLGCNDAPEEEGWPDACGPSATCHAATAAEPTAALTCSCGDGFAPRASASTSAADAPYLDGCQAAPASSGEETSGVGLMVAAAVVTFLGMGALVARG